MNNSINTTLIERIRKKCGIESWFGPSLLGPQYVEVPEADVRRTRFAFLPATLAQIQHTEEQLGQELPPFLIALLCELANGGFGPGAGILGGVGGYQWNGRTLVNATLQRGSTFLVNLENQWVTWPPTLLPLCDVGDVNEVCLDTQTNLILLVAPTDYVRGIVPVMTYEYASLEQWLYRWIHE